MAWKPKRRTPPRPASSAKLTQSIVEMADVVLTGSKDGSLANGMCVSAEDDRAALEAALDRAIMALEAARTITQLVRELMARGPSTHTASRGEVTLTVIVPEPNQKRIEDD